MRSRLILFLLLAFQQVLEAQDTVNFNEYRPNGKIIHVNSNPILVKKLLNTQFSNLVTGQTKNSIGNFASLDITDPTVSFAGNLILNNGSVLTVKASGGISDGFFSIFDHSKLNTNVTLDVQYNFLALGRKTLVTDVDSEDVYNLAIDKIQYGYDTKRLAILANRDSLDLVKRLVAIQTDITSLQIAVDHTPASAIKDSLQYELGKKTILHDSIQNAIRNFPGQLGLLRNLHNKTVQQLEGLSLTSAIQGFSFGWFSVGYKVSNNAFSYFNPALAFDAQVVDTNLVSHQARLQYSYYKWVPQSYRSYFWDAGLSFNYTDNFNTLKKREISETTEYGATPGARTKIRKYNVYQGTYNRDIKGVTIYTDLYYFLFNNNVGAVHLNPEWVTQSKEKPVGNVYVGFLLAFKSGKTDNPVVNAELYYKFLDVFKTTDTEYKLFERNKIGIRFTFPIQFRYNLN